MSGSSRRSRRCSASRAWRRCTWCRPRATSGPRPGSPSPPSPGPGRSSPRPSSGTPSASAIPPARPAGWTQSAAAALSGPLAPLTGADAVATALIWVGAAVVLGLILDVSGPAPLAIGGLVWAAGLIAALGAVGGAAGPSPLLTPALLGAVVLLAWDRAGRPRPSHGSLALPGRGATTLDEPRPRPSAAAPPYRRRSAMSGPGPHEPPRATCVRPFMVRVLAAGCRSIPAARRSPCAGGYAVRQRRRRRGTGLTV